VNSTQHNSTQLNTTQHNSTQLNTTSLSNCFTGASLRRRLSHRNCGPKGRNREKNDKRSALVLDQLQDNCLLLLRLNLCFYRNYIIWWQSMSDHVMREMHKKFTSFEVKSCDNTWSSFKGLLQSLNRVTCFYSINQSMNQWMNESMSEWINEWINTCFIVF
jgi:hypothetical protein